MGSAFTPNIIDCVMPGEQYEQVCIKILEEPQSRGYRFRYECEGHSHGGLQGAGSEKSSKTYPTISIQGLKEPLAQLTVSLWTASEPARPHVHDFIGKNCSDGKFVMDVKQESYGKVILNNLSIRNTKKTDVARILKERKVKERDMQFLPDEQLMQAAEAEAKELPLNVVRLKFEVTLVGDQFTGVVATAMSKPVYDSKCPAANLLKICRISCSAGTCRGDTEVFMLCEKVQKDIQIRFREKDNGGCKWEAFATFAPVDIHRQYAIVFRTPPYCNQQLTDDVEVELQLFRPSDGQESPSLPFKYCADQTEQDQIVRKRKRVVFGQSTSSNCNFVFDAFPGFALASGGQGDRASSETGYQGTILPNIGTLDETYLAFAPDLSSNLVGSNQISFASYTTLLHNQALVSEMPQPGSECQLSIVEQAEMQPLMPTTTSDIAELDFNLNPDLSGDLVEMDSAPEPEVARPVAPCEVPGWKDPSRIKVRPLSPRTAAAESVLDFYEGADLNATCSSSAKRAHGQRTEESKKSRWALPSEHKLLDVSALSSAKTTSLPATGNAAAAASATTHVDPYFALMQKVASELTRSVHDYATSGDVRFVLAVARGLFCEQDYNGDNAFHIAVIHEQLDALHNLLSAAKGSGDVTTDALGQKNFAGQTPLHLASVLRQARVVELLLGHGADAAAHDANGNSVWHLAAKGADLAVLRVLRSCVPADVARRCVGMLNYEGLSALHLAVRAKAADCVEELMACGADANLADGKSGRTALHHAVECDDINLTSYLIFTAGANMDQPSYDGNTPLHVAAATGNVGIVATLVAFGADMLLENYDPKECECESEACQHAEDGVHCHTPLDVARSRQIRDILAGKQSCRDDLPAQSLACRTTSPSASTLAHHVTGDMARLDDSSRRALAVMLDRSPELWARLAVLVGLKELVPALKDATSPTQALLTDYEAMDGTTADLCRCLIQMNLHDAALIVERQCPSASKNVDSSSCDSGVGVSFANLDSLHSLDSC